MVSLDPSHVPLSLHWVIPLAEKWGLSDDVARAERVDQARTDELRELLELFDTVDADTLYGWLAGAQSYSLSPTDEYVAFSALTMAADYARAVHSTEHDQ